MSGLNKSNNSKLRIEVAGNKYLLSIDKLLRKPTTKLGKIAESLKENGKVSDDMLTFDRPIVAFEAIQAYYQTDELHMPTNICPLAFKQELEFWEIGPCELHRCCLFKFIAALDDFETTTEFQQSMAQDNKPCSKKCTGSMWINCKHRMWTVLENEDQTILSRVYLITAVFFVLVSITSLALSTVPCFRVSLDLCEEFELFKAVGEFDDTIGEFLQVANCTGDMNKQWKIFEIDRTGNMTSLPAKLADIVNSNHTKTHDVFRVLNYITDAFFTLELIIRLTCCPSLRKYFLSILNILDISVLVAAYTAYIVDNTNVKYRYDEKGLEILHYFEMLRVLRILRVVQNLAAIRVLRFTLKTNRKDMYVLGLYLFIGVVLFANFVYFAEETRHIPSIPEAWWWSVITMTTVGYGDVVPKTPTGKVIGVLCALSGVLLLGLVVPMFVTTFLSLYKVANLNERIMNTNSGRKEGICHKKATENPSVCTIKPM